MFSGKPISLQFRLSSVLWSASLLAIMINYSKEVDENISLWQILMLFIIGISALTVLLLIPFSFFLSQEQSFLNTLKTIILVLCGPALLSLSGYAFFNEIELNISIYILSFISWCLFFSVSIYCSFKLVLEMSLYCSRKQKKNKLVTHFEQVSLRNLRQ